MRSKRCCRCSPAARWWRLAGRGRLAHWILTSLFALMAATACKQGVGGKTHKCANAASPLPATESHESPAPAAGKPPPTRPTNSPVAQPTEPQSAHARESKEHEVKSHDAAPAPSANRYLWLAQGAEVTSVLARVATPPGFTRVKLKPSSFGSWLRTLPVKGGRPPVLLHDGTEKGNQAAHELVLDIDTGPRDLQQCADAVMRLRAEYLYSEGRFQNIHFNFTSGDRSSFDRWRQGYRPMIKDNLVSFSQTAGPDSSYRSFRSFLDSIFTYAGTASLSREMSPVDVGEISPGDVFIIGGFPGHAVIVIDVAQSNSGTERLFLLAQSYMPAQDMHILKNPTSAKNSPWYSADFGARLVTPEWTFKASDLKAFGD